MSIIANVRSPWRDSGPPQRGMNGLYGVLVRPFIGGRRALYATLELADGTWLTYDWKDVRIVGTAFVE